MTSELNSKKIKLADLDVEMDKIEAELQSKGEALVNKAKSIVSLAGRFTGIPIPKEKTDFNPARLSEIIKKLDPSYFNSALLEEIRIAVFEYVELEDKKIGFEAERTRLKKDIVFSSKLSK